MWQCKIKTIQLLSSQSTKNERNDTSSNELLPAFNRQSKYWIPLLLSWLRGDNTNTDFDNDNPFDGLPLTKKQMKHNRQKLNRSSPSNNNTPEVQIEALRALTALTEWTNSTHKMGLSDCSNEDGGERQQQQFSSNTNTDSTNNNDICTPHNPLSTSTIRLLLKHSSNSIHMLVTLLSSSDVNVYTQIVWILGSIASSGLSASSLPSKTSNAVKAARAAAKEMTKLMIENKGMEDGNTSLSVALPTGGNNMLGNEEEEEDYDDEEDDISPPSRGKDKNLSARDVIFAAGALEPLLMCLAAHPDNITLQRVGAWTLSSLVEGRYSSSSNDKDKDTSSSSRKQPCASEELDIVTFLPAMKRMLYMEDTEVLTFTCWTLSHLCDGPAFHIAAVIYSETSVSKPNTVMSAENGLVPRLVELLLHPSPKVAKPALRTVGNIVCADCADQHDQFGNTLPVVDFTEIVLECEAVPCLRQLIDHPNREIQKEACWTLSNIAAGTANQIQAVIECGAIRPLVDIVSNKGTDKEVRSEACWVVLNATSCGNDEQISILIEEGCVSVLGVLLLEPNMVMMALEGIERVLQCEEAQDSEDLYRKRADEELGQRPTIIKCASLIKAVTESQDNSSAVLKRAKRIWEHHFISCALCHNNYSRCRLADSHFCNECKCHVCSKCDCRVYHLSYQEELWAEDEEKAAESKTKKKSKKQKKKAKEQAKKERAAAEKKKLEDKAVQQQQSKPTALKGGASAASASEQKKPVNTKEVKNESGSSKASEKSHVKWATGKTTSSTPSRGTIESDTASLGATDFNGGGDNTALDETSETNCGQPPIDLVSYLQQTGSIIALAKLMDSLYDNEYEDEEVDRVENMDRVLTTQ